MSGRAVDWTTMDGCERCSAHGPFLPGGVFYVGEEGERDAHQAWHGLVASAMPWQRLLLTADRVAHALAMPRRKP